MTHTDIAAEHKDVKTGAYWDNLVGGGTAAYKERRIDELLRRHRPERVESMIDIGCGTCELLFRYKAELGAQSLVCMDYDPGVIAFLKGKYPGEAVDWVVADVFELGRSDKRFDLVFLLDMVHEVYSFYGRADRDVEQPVDHALGLGAVGRLLDNVAEATRPGGAVIITDNVLSEEDKDVTVRLKSPKVIQTVKYFLEHYPTRRITADFARPDEMVINARDFCILLTQYNKIKAENWDRWNVEKMEIHQYFSLSEYEAEFGKRGFQVHAFVETPADALEEWSADFEMVEGLPALPPKRITLLAKKAG
jgi:SAM-dependent methyltransferase